MFVSTAAVWSWFKAKPTWQKCFLWVVLILGLILVVAFKLLFPSLSKDTSTDDAKTDISIKHIEEVKEKKLEDLEEEEDIINKDIRAAEEEDARISREITEKVRTRDETHKALDSKDVGDFDSIDRLFDEFVAKKFKKD